MDLSEAYSPAAAIINVPMGSPVEWGAGEIVLERSGALRGQDLDKEFWMT